ncbi:MAG: amino acid ABC transporter permease [Acidimicrobiia bacterium]
MISHTPTEWIRSRLFQNWWSGVVTLVLLPIVLYVAYRALLFVFVNGQWEVVTRNLTLFMQGTFSRAQQWRLIAQILIFALALGVGAGTSRASARDRARDAGLTFHEESVRATFARMWSLVGFVALLLYFATVDEAGNLLNPFILVGGAVVTAVAGFQAKLFPRSLRNLGWLLTAVLLLIGFQVVSGFGADDWIPLALILGVTAYVVTPAPFQAGWLRFVARLVAAFVVALLVRLAYSVVDSPGIGWDNWSGLHLTLMVSAIAIGLAFPIGLLLALGRRSSMPALRVMSTTYIELIRGVPLITLLFTGQFVLQQLLPEETDLSQITRAIAAITLFTAAYVAEIVRGGLQAVPRGQTEAAHALGLSPPKTTRLIVMPQALRAVIPAMVGQFISLFKDSSLLTIIGIAEYLGVREIAHAQADFRGVAVAETLVFVAIGYWAFSFAMSRESQRLERRLRVSK